MPISNVSTQAPTDFAIQAQEIERRRKMAEALQAQSLQPFENQMAGGYVIPTSPTQGLAKMFQGYLGQKGQDRATEQQKALAAAMRGERQQTVEQAMAAMQGTPGTPEQNISLPTPNDDEGNAMPAAVQPAQAAVPGDPRKAYGILAGSQDPQLSALGLQGAIPKPQAPYSMRPNETRYDENNRPIVTAPAPVAPPKYHVVNGNLVPEPAAPAAGTPVGPAPQVTPVYTAPEKPKEKWGEPYQLGGQTVQKNAETGQIRQAVTLPPRISTSNTVVNSGPKAFETELGKLDAEQLGKFRDNAQSAQNTLGIVENLRDAVKRGVYSGGGANMKAEAANIINGITGITPKGLVGSQLFTSEASKLVLEKIKQLGANPSNADREFIEKTVPQLGQSAQARDALINFLETKAGQQIQLYQQADTHARSNHGLGGFNVVQPPQAQQPQAPGAPAVERRKAPAGVTRYDANGKRIDG